MTYGKYFEKTMNKFIIGYSLGSLISLNVAVDKKDFFDGVVLLAPPLGMVNKENSMKFKIMQVLNKVFPSLPFIKLDSKYFLINLAENFTKNKQVVENYVNDPLTYKGKYLKLSTVLSILNLSIFAENKAKLLNIPCLILHGKDDLIASPKNACEFFDKIEFKNKEMVLLEGKIKIILK